MDMDEDGNVQTVNGRILTKNSDLSLTADIDSEPNLPDGFPTVVPPNPRLAALIDQASVGAEKFRMLATRLRYFQKQRRLKTLIVTSTVQGEGKSVISANLSVTLARHQRTLLIDGDLRRSGLTDLLGTRNLPGISDWWDSKAPISRFLHRVESVSLWHLPSGEPAQEPLELLQSQRMNAALAQLAESFEWVVIDTPPLAPVADCQAWATHAQGTLLVVRQGMTPTKLLQTAMENADNLKLLGVVMNASQDAHQRYYAQYYGHRRQGTSTATSAPKADPASVTRS
jgi:capsular exopolysaccharide synthesis family protein